MLELQRSGKTLHEVGHPLSLLIQNIAQIAPVIDQFQGAVILLHQISQLRQAAPDIQQHTVFQASGFQLIQSQCHLIRPVGHGGVIRQTEPHPLWHRRRGQLHFHTPTVILWDESLAGVARCGGVFGVLHIAVSYEQAGVPVLIAAAQRLQVRIVHGAFRQMAFVP